MPALGKLLIAYKSLGADEIPPPAGKLFLQLKAL